MQDTLSRTFAALADPTRRALLSRLSRGEANVSQLARPFLKGMSLPAVVKRTWDAINRRNGTNTKMPTNTATSLGPPPGALDLPDVTDADIEDLVPKPRTPKPRNSRRTRDDEDRDDDYDTNADWR